jgi:hypothetical protein
MSGAALLRSLMDDHGLRQSELPEIGTQSDVAEILEGRRPISARQARALGGRFAINPGAFLVVTNDGRPLGERLKPLQDQLDALPRSGLVADKAFFDSLDGPDDDKPRDPETDRGP